MPTPNLYVASETDPFAEVPQALHRTEGDVLYATDRMPEHAKDGTGLALLAYPLHPPGRLDKLRDAHLPGVGCPMLFVQGTRDSFGRFDLIESLVNKLGERASLLRVEDGDHSFKVRKSSGQTAEDVERLIHDGLLAWLKQNHL